MKPILLFFLSALGIVTFLNSCSKEYSFERGVPIGDAKGSLTDTSGNCLYDSVHGTFYNGVEPGSDTAYVEIQVQVDSPGNYRIYSDLENGFMFGDSGYFNTTGINTIKLKPIGMPILNTVTHFTLEFDSTFCGFDVYVQDSTGTGLGGGGGTGGTDSTNMSDTAWSFSNDASVYNGPFDSAFVGIDQSTGATYLALFGSTAATGDSLFNLDVLLPSGAITVDTFSTLSGSVISFSKATDSSTIYYADSTTTGANMKITITSYDPIQNLVTGTFEGTAYVTAQGDLITINSGRFKAKLH